MNILPLLLTVFQGVCGIVSLVCFIIVLIKMFQNDQTVLGIVCIVLAFCGGLGSLIAFVFGWVKSSEWQLKNVMLIWSLFLVLGIVTSIIVMMTWVAVVPGDAGLQMQDLQIDLGQ